MWIYVFSLSIGLILLVPTILQAIDGGSDSRSDPSATGESPRTRFGLFAFFGFALSVFAASGLVISAFSPGRLATVVAALTLGLASGAVHPELLGALSKR